MIVCLQRATVIERFAEDMDCSTFVGKPVRHGEDIVGVVLRGWVREGSLYADIDIAHEVEDWLAAVIPVDFRQA